jgi:hypothetical protein
LNKNSLESKRLNLISKESIMSGLKRFYREYDHFPTAEEIDGCPYLCSARHIQRVHGGLRKLRESLGMDIVDYGKGKPRIDRWKRVSKLSVETESSVKNFLMDTYGEICVHEEKKYGNLRQRMDFFVYAKENFAVDVFNTYTLRHLNIIINIKFKKYRIFPFKLFFVVTGTEFHQKDVDELILRKHYELLPSMKCLTIGEFKKECLLNLPPLSSHLKYTSCFQRQF